MEPIRNKPATADLREMFCTIGLQKPHFERELKGLKELFGALQLFGTSAPIITK
jgi:hypothetical protein